MSKTCTPEPVFVYVAYSRKLPNLPIAIGDSIGELAQQCGMSIKDTSFGIGGTDDEYVSSSFGSIEDALRKELGVERIREDLCILLCKASGGKL